MTPCNLVEVYKCFKEMYCFHPHDRRVRIMLNFLIIAYLSYSSTLKMEVVSFSGTSIDLYHSIRCQISNTM
jgi:hypothetical protein